MLDSKPTILQIIPAMHSGGVERGVADLSKKLSNSGFNSIVLSSGGSMTYLLEKNDIKHIKHDIHTKNPYKIFKNINVIRNIIDKYAVDIVHTRSRAPAISAYYACQKIKNVKLVSTIHGPYSTHLLNQKKESKIKKLYNSYALKADKIIAVSEFVKDYIINNYEQNLKNKIAVIPRGVDETDFNPDHISIERIITLAKNWSIPEDKKVILFPARITSWKGHEFLLNSLKKVKEDYVCIFVGSDHGHERFSEKIKQKIIDNNLSSKIRIFDNQSDMPLTYSLANIVISASTKPEAFGRVSIESQAMKKIIIATGIGGSLETIKDKETGFLVKNLDEDDFAKKIDLALRLSSQEINKITQSARSNILENFTNEKMFNSTISIYKELLG